MKTEAGMCGAHCPGSAGLWLRGCWAFSLVMMVVLGPGSAVGQTEGFEEEDAALLWESGPCEEVAELYLKEYPKGSDAAKARECLEAMADEEDMRRMKRYEEGAYKALERGNVAGAKRRLEAMRELAGKAPEVMDLEDAIAEAEEKWGKMREYAKTGHEAVGRGDLEKAGRYVERMRGLDAGSSLVVELEEAMADAEAERRRAEEEARRRRAEVEESYWKKCEENDEARHCEEYLSRYEDGEYVRLAKQRLAELEVPSRETKFRDCAQCPEMVVVPAGSFMMGSPESEGGRYDDEGPVHRVTFARPFAVGVYEVTRGEYGRFVSARGHASGDSCWMYEGGEWEERTGRNWRNPGFRQTDAHPVVCVNRDDAQAYVEWLSEKTDEKYRLLSESEWEYVARAGTVTARYWGESESEQCRHANGADREAKRHNSGWTTVDCDDGYYRTASVGSFAPNGYKLHDVLGNVWEWVEDCWNESYDGAPTDGRAWESEGCSRRVLRGGSWYGRPGNLRSANRLWSPSGNRSNYNGFRVARTLTP